MNSRQLFRSTLLIIVASGLVSVASTVVAGPGPKSNSMQAAAPAAPAARSPILERKRAQIEAEADKFGCDPDAPQKYPWAKKLPWAQLGTWCLPGGRWYVGPETSAPVLVLKPGERRSVTVVAEFRGGKPEHGASNSSRLRITVSEAPLGPRSADTLTWSPRSITFDKPLGLRLQPSGVNQRNLGEAANLFDGFLPTDTPANVMANRGPLFSVKRVESGLQIASISFPLERHIEVSFEPSLASPAQKGAATLYQEQRQAAIDLLGLDLQLPIATPLASRPAANRPITDKHRTYLHVEADKFGCDIDAIPAYTWAKRLPWHELNFICLPGGRWLVGPVRTAVLTQYKSDTVEVVAPIQSSEYPDRIYDVLITVNATPFANIAEQLTSNPLKFEYSKDLDLLIRPLGVERPGGLKYAYEGFLTEQGARARGLTPKPSFRIEQGAAGFKITSFRFFLNPTTAVTARLTISCGQPCSPGLTTGPDLLNYFKTGVEELLGYDIKALK